MNTCGEGREGFPFKTEFPYQNKNKFTEKKTKKKNYKIF